MKHQMRKRRAKGGDVESPHDGVREYEQDLAQNPSSYTADSNVTKEAEEKKRGGRAKHKHGGHVVHHDKGHVKHVGSVHGAATKHHAGRKARKSGGRAGSDMNPLSSAHAGTPAKAHKDVEID